MAEPLFNRKTLDGQLAVTNRIKIAEAEINTRVYALFELTGDEIDLLEASIYVPTSGSISSCRVLPNSATNATQTKPKAPAKSLISVSLKSVGRLP